MSGENIAGPGATAARAASRPGAHGVRVLGNSDVEYADGAEDYVTAVLEIAQDRRELSDELALAARTWPERYHLDRGRANLLHPLDLPASAKVLEIGCGCGAVTSHLAARCALVDAVEPAPLRARAARARTRGIGDVEVFVGEVDDLPAAPAYDVAVVVGVLEYVGGGSTSDEPYVEFLRSVRARLVDGGALVLAIENRLGVRYLAGGPEDHTGVPWDGVNGYPDGAPVRTFSRGHLVRLLRAAGFADAQVLSAFPDYKFARVVLSDELITSEPRLACALPRFPSPDRTEPVDRPLREGALWAELVDCGTAGAHGNSFVVVAGKDAPASLWPSDTLAAFFNTDRARDFCTSAVVRRGAEGVVVEHKPMTSARAVRGVSVVATADPVRDLPLLADELVHAPDRAALLAAWRQTVESTADTLGGRMWDLIPQNLLYGNELVPIDLEWSVAGCTVRDVLLRGVLLTADHIASSVAANGRTVRDLVAELAAELEFADFDLAEAIAVEAGFQAISHNGEMDAELREARTKEMTEAWQTRLNEPVG
jgi:SAM-dependent methyltransferase